MKNWLGQELNIGTVVVKVDHKDLSRIGVITATRVHEDFYGYKTNQVQCTWAFECRYDGVSRKYKSYGDKPGWCIASRLIVVDESVLDALYEV